MCLGYHLIEKNYRDLMSDLEIEEGLETVLKELDQTKGVEGAIIVNSVGEILKHTLKSSGDLSLFGPMAQVIHSSSQRLLGSAGLGKMEKVLLESKKGKSLFLQLKKVHLIILIEKNANLGMVIMAAHRVSPRIMEITRDMEVDESSLPEMTSAGPVLESMEESIPKEDSLEKTVPETLTELEEETAGQMGGATVSADVTSDDIRKTDAVPEVEVNAEAQILPDKESTSRAEISDLVTEELKPPSELDVEDMEGEAVSAESLAEKPVIPSIKPPYHYLAFLIVCDPDDPWEELTSWSKSMKPCFWPCPLAPVRSWACLQPGAY